LEFFPTTAKTPLLSIEEAAVAAADALTEALQSNNPPINLPELKDPAISALQQLDAIFQHKQEPSVPLPRVAPTPRVAPEHAVEMPRDDTEPIATRTRSGGQVQQPYNLWANAVLHPVTGKSMEYRKIITDPVMKNDWLISSANEFGRLMQGVGGRVKGTDTMHFINRSDMPPGRTATYP
jgi:hypothetical protein